jgi:hypothetical protein
LRRDVLADTIEIRHVPAMPGDPEIVGKQHFGSDLSALKKAMKDFRMDIASTILEADAFTVKLTLVGTRVSGARYSSAMSLRFQMAYQPMAESWAVYDNSGASPQLLERKK